MVGAILLIRYIDITMLALGFLSIHLLTFHGFADASGIFYEDITESVGNTINGKSIQRTSFIHKSFHQCSLNETCNYVIKNVADGKFNLYNSKDELPVKMTGLRIWKKFYYSKHIHSFYYILFMCVYVCACVRGRVRVCV